MEREEIFSHNGGNFRIRTFKTGQGYCVKVFLNGKVIRPVYSVDVETYEDYFYQHHESLVDNLKTIVKSDIERGIYLTETGFNLK